MKRNVMGWSIKSMGDEFRKGIYTSGEIKGAIGTISSPLLDLPLKNSLVMRTGTGSVNFTRSTTATYIDRYGVLRYANIDEPRFEKDGLLIEGTSTNAVLGASDLSNTDYWGIDSDLTVSNVESFDGGNNAIKLIPNAVTEAFAYLNLNTDVPDGTRTFSFYLKNDSNWALGWIRVGFGNSNRFFNILTDKVGSGSGTIKRKYMNNGWSRIVYTVNCESENRHGDIRFGKSSGSSTNVDGDGETGITIFAPQSEVMPFATSYIPTTDSAVTKGADICSITLDNNTPSDNIRTIAIEAKLLGINQNVDNYLYAHEGLSNVTGVARSNGDIDLYGTARTQTIGYDIVSNKLKVVQASTNDSISSFVNGALTTSESNSGLPVYAGGGQIVLGRNKVATTNHISYGHFTGFKIYDKALTAVEVALLC